MKCPFLIKVCSKCRRILVANTENFYKKSNGKYGLRADCKICNNKFNSKINYSPINEETKLKKCSKCKLDFPSTEKYFYKNHRCKDGLSSHCKICDDKKTKKYSNEHPHIRFNNHIKRRKLEENQGYGISNEQWLEMMEFFDWRCAYSGEYLGNNINFNRTIDHIIPLNKGGLNEVWNCVPMLKSYNSSKGNKDMLDWYKKQNFYSEERLQKIYQWIEYAKEKWK